MALEMKVDGEKMAPNNAAMIEKLPSDIVVRVNEFLKLPDRIRLASCNKQLQRVVYQDCVPLWIDIDFSKVDCKAREHLTDAILARLLTRVNAKTVTRSLNIEGCYKLVGTGLEPLKSSKTLEKIDIRGVSMSEDVFIPILRTMIPFQLKQVLFRPKNYATLQGTAPSDFTKFLWDLHAARLQQAREDKLMCSGCNTSVVNDARQVVPNGCGVSPTCCGTCSKHFCRHSSCDVGLADCDFCGDTSCDACAKVTRCSNCLFYCCEPCDPTISCNTCTKRSCAECFSDIGGDTCEDCDKKICGDCRDQQPDLMNFCEGCFESRCNDCRQTKFCESCQTDVCVKCTNFLDCRICSRSFCSWCDEANWHIELCRQCNKKVCNDCRDQQVNLLGYCESCNEHFCGACRETNVCYSCESSFCVECVNDFLKCGSCDKLLCEKCRTKSCGTCHKSCCNDDCAFVDTCEQCEATFCAGCAVVVRCPLCGTSCCDSCRSRRGCCPTCDEKPSKKARLSL